HAAEQLRAREGEIEDLAADVVEIDVDVPDLVAQLAGLVIEAIVEAELVLHIGALFRTAGDAERAAAPQLGELAHHAADRSGSRRHQRRFARLRLAQLLQAEIRGQARHAEHAEVIAERYARGVDLARFLGHAVEL